MGDRVALMNEGVLQQVDTPDNIYNKPANTFVAAFIGSPAMNLFKVTLEPEAGSGVTVLMGSRRLQIPAAVAAAHPGLADRVGGEIVIGIRPEDMEDISLQPDHPKEQCITAKSFLVESLGSDQFVHFGLDAVMAKIIDPDTPDELEVEDVSAVCVARFGARSTVKSGQDVTVAVQTDRIHFFDAANGLAL